ncbi:hypothetical protein [Saccharicrinis fermentans]|uniref:ABC-2 family transporter protein n=1 Tax=Saccharicrinis fermentans DSM 9555 = JCM 21142 TaxID=869213 RepID=W7YH35_9BACT|nr:hypothetical protein [Saccharicrinis fermentans]GAF01919.1 hypothetical protein JCM21142_541 [Saccharicrinis fermentans DSM 9555 = JCM 21142]
MKKALIYKEWKKTRFISMGILLTGVLLMIYIFISVGRSFRFAGMEHLWDIIVNRKQFLFRDIKYFPVITGIGMSVAQFVPEIIQKRIKLTLHLPLKESSIIKLMLGYGLGVLLLTFLVQCIALYIFSCCYFPTEFVVSTFQTVIPWYLAGLVSYLLVAGITLEPTWKMRIIYSIMGFATIRLYFLSFMPGAMVPMLWLVVCIAILLFPLSLLSVHRFKNGNID